MAKKTLLTSGATFHKVKKGFITSGGVYHKIKKAFVTEGGVYRACWGGSPAEMEISSTGAMTDYGLVKMGDGNTYRLVALTGSGTVTFAEPAQGEVWVCGGGTSGGKARDGGEPGGGGAGAFTATGTVSLSGGMVAVVGAGGATNNTKDTHKDGGLSSFGGLETSVSFSDYGGSYGRNGGTGGGGHYNQAGKGDGVTKYPFGDSSYFKCHCAGGGGGGYVREDKYCYTGGVGGTNGGSGGKGTQTDAYTGSSAGGAGGNYGGGKGGTGSGGTRPGGAATFYGSGGGGHGCHDSGMVGTGGAGYQGVIYIRIKAA